MGRGAARPALWHRMVRLSDPEPDHQRERTMVFESGADQRAGFRSWRAVRIAVSRRPGKIPADVRKRDPGLGPYTGLGRVLRGPVRRRVHADTGGRARAR